MDFSEGLLPVLVTVLTKAAIVAAIAIVGLLVSKFLTDILVKLLRRSKVDETLIGFFSRLVYYSLLLVVALIALGFLGVPMTSVIAILGASVLAIGIALQDSIANLAAGILIIGLRPYVVNDFIEVNDVSGYVSQIGFFNTMLTTRDNKTVFVPNKNVLSGNLTNYSKTELIRLELVYGISYTDDVRKAKEILESIVAGEDRVSKNPLPQVAVKELGDSSVNFVVRPYVAVRDEYQVTFAITEQVKLRFDEEGISIPFPQRDVYLYQQNGNGVPQVS